MKIFLTKYLFLAQKHGIRTTKRSASAQRTRKRPASRDAGEKAGATTWLIGKTIPMTGFSTSHVVFRWKDIHKMNINYLM